MTWAAQTLQAVAFTSDHVAAKELFEPTFRRDFTSLEAAPPGLVGSAASFADNGVQRALQTQPGRVDLYLAPTTVPSDPMVFMPLPMSDYTDQMLEAMLSLGSRLSNTSRLALISRFVRRVPSPEAATEAFAELTGVPKNDLGQADHMFQTNLRKSLPTAGWSSLNRVVQVRTEALQVIDVRPASGGLAAGFQQDTHSALSLTFDINIPSQTGVLPPLDVPEIVNLLVSETVTMRSVYLPQLIG